MNWKFIGLGLLFLAVLGTVLFILSIERRSDKELIFQALNDAIEASMEGRPGGVLDFLSDELKINETGDISKSYIAQLIRDSKPSVKVLNKEVKMLPGGDEAEIVSDVDVKANVKALSFSQTFDHRFKDARMVFRKESGRKFLFIPVKVWRLIEVSLPNDAGVVEQGF